MKYEQVWEAVDKLAKINGLSPSGLAKKAGLDATTFNKSKRTRPDGKKRWPSLDSLNKIIEVCNISFDEFFALAGNENEDKIVHSIPYIECSRLIEGEKTICIDFRKNKWQRIRFPDGHDNLYALDINTDQFAPFYRNGTLLILSQESEIRRGDRIAVFMSDNSIEEKVRSIIVDQLGVESDKVTADAKFIEDLGADSLDTVELVMAFEENFDIEVPDEEAEKLQSVADVVAYIEKVQG